MIPTIIFIVLLGVAIAIVPGLFRPKTQKKAANNANEHKTAPDNKTDYIQDLIELKALLDSGTITQAEFEKEKANLLNNANNS